MRFLDWMRQRLRSCGRMRECLTGLFYMLIENTHVRTDSLLVCLTGVILVYDIYVIFFCLCIFSWVYDIYVFLFFRQIQIFY